MNIFAVWLYLILFLYQTTTQTVSFVSQVRCILFCSYIKPQQVVGVHEAEHRCILFCSYIKPQPIVSVKMSNTRCILFCSYIKPQLTLLYSI